MIAARFAPPTALLLVLAVAPTLIHNYKGLTVDDGLTVTAIQAVLDNLPSRPTNRRSGWGLEHLASEDWMERTYRVGQEDVRLFAARSYDAKRLYHHPELAVLRGFETRSAGLSTLPGRPEAAIHLLTTSQKGRRGVAAYALLYDGLYVRNPIAFQLRTAVPLMFGGRRAMTLFLASDLSGSLDRLDQAPAVKVLAAAIQAFEAQTPVTR